MLASSMPVAQGCRMSRHFNTAGPNDPRDHYTLPPELRLPAARGLVDQKG